MSDVATRIQALERHIASSEPDARRAVRELLVDDGGRHLVMERLPRLGRAAAEPVRELLLDPEIDPEVRVMAALVGLEVGEHAGLTALHQEIARAGPLGLIASARLASRGVPETDRAVTEGRWRLDPSDADRVVAYLDALRKTGAALSGDLRERLATSSAWQVTSALDEWFPCT